MARLSFTAIFIFAILFTHFSHAQVVVTPGTFPLSCQGAPGFIMQTSPIVISETLPTDFGINSTQILYNLQFPAGYEFYGADFTVTINSGDIINFTYQYYVNGILISYDCPTQTKIDVITISGIQLQIHLASPTNINLVRTMVPTNAEAPQNGNMVANAQNHATLISTYPPPALVPTISLTRTFFCSDDNTLYPLTLSPAGGALTPRPGLIGTNFKPSAATVYYPTLTTLEYHYNYMSCPFYANTNIIVQLAPSPTLTDDDADNIICPGQPVTFTGLPSFVGYRYQFLKNGILVQGPTYNGNTYITTSLANGDVISVIVDTGPGSCSTEVADAAFTVINIPGPSVSFPTLPALICSNNTNSFAATLNPSGGTLSGSGISASNFTPSLASAGINVINYAGTYLGCAYSTTANVNVTAAPTVTISSSDADNIICEGDQVTFSANTGGTANRYLFIKNGNGIQGPNANNNYITTTLADGDNVSVIVDNGISTCAAVSSGIVTTVGQYPKASFTWAYACGSSQVNYYSHSTIPAGSTIVTYKWDPENNNIIDPVNLDYGAHLYPTYEDDSARLTVISDKGCADDTLIRVYTTPSVNVTPAAPYAVNFATSSQGWNYDGQNSSWHWGLAPAAFGLNRNVWSTGHASDNKYNADEKSYLYSPCFQMQALYKPMIALKLSSRISGKLAGTILEASKDNGTNWEKVGTIGLGQNWYNEIAIASRPGTDLASGTFNNLTNEGWTDDLTGVIARFDLQKYAGMVNIRLRLNFASVKDSTVDRDAGFALDSVFVGQRNKLVLIESFTNYPNDPNSTIAQSYLNIIANKRATDIVELNYHTGNGSNVTDNYYSLNSADPSARILYYGTDVANSAVDGKYLYLTYKGKLDTNIVDSRALDPAQFKIDLSTTITQGLPGNITSSARITYIGDSKFTSDVIVHFAVVENGIYNDPNENFACRHMMPDAGGDPIRGITWTPVSGPIIVTESWWDNYIYGYKNLGVVVFLQNNTTKEVYQAAYLLGSGDYGTHVVASVKDSTNSAFDVSLYPNPAKDEVNIIYGSGIDEEYKWEIYDNLGKSVSSGIDERGLQGFTINTSSFAEGAYYLKIISSKSMVTKKLIVVR